MSDSPSSLDEAVTDFLRSPLLDRYSSLSKSYFIALNSQCATDFKMTCSQVQGTTTSGSENSINHPAIGQISSVQNIHHFDNERNTVEKKMFLRENHNHHENSEQDSKEFHLMYHDHHEEHEEHGHEHWGGPAIVDDHHHNQQQQQHHGPPPRPDLLHHQMEELRLVSLGYGSQGDACLVNAFPTLSGGCQRSLLDVADLHHQYSIQMAASGGRRFYDGPPPHHPVLGLLIVFATVASVIFCCIRCFRQKHHQHDVLKYQARAVIVAINNNPILKDHVENSTGLQVPFFPSPEAENPPPPAMSFFGNLFRSNRPYGAMMTNNYRVHTPTAPPAYTSTGTGTGTGNMSTGQSAAANEYSRLNTATATNNTSSARPAVIV